jgi:hypothetical protein
MENMFRRPLLRFSILLAAIVLFAGASVLRAQDDTRHGRKYKAPPPSARIEVTILKADNGKPIQEAHVIFHPVQGDKDKGDLELKTDEDGKAVIDVLPIGDTVRLQVIANGYQTYGQDYKVDQPKLYWEVCLRRPGPQYSTYTNHPTSLGASTCPDNISRQNPGNSSGGDKSPNASQTTTPPPSDSKSSSQPDPPSATPSQPQPQSE